MAQPVGAESLSLAAEAFRRDGVVCLRAALDAHALTLAEAAYAYSLAHPSPRASRYYQDTGTTFYQDLFNLDVWPAYRRTLEETVLGEMLAGLFGSPDVWMYYEQVFLKEGGNSRRTPWHQDSSYLPIAGNDFAVVWISFDPVAKEDALEFIPGSHRGPLYNGSSFAADDDTAPIYAGESMPRLPDIEADRARWDIVSWGVEPGDLIVFHPAILHGGAPTHEGQRRRTLSLRFFGTDARYEPRPERLGSTPSPSQQERHRLLYGHLKPGDPFRNPLFARL